MSEDALGFLALIPIVLIIVVVYCAIKCSEFHSTRWKELRLWSRRRVFGRHKRNKSDQANTEIRGSIDLESGLTSSPKL